MTGKHIFTMTSSDTTLIKMNGVNLSPLLAQVLVPHMQWSHPLLEGGKSIYLVSTHFSKS